MNKLLIFFLLNSIAVTQFGQVEVDKLAVLFRNVEDSYLALKEYSAHITVEVSMSNGLTTTSEGLVMKSGSSFMSELFGQRTVSTNDWTVIINEKNKSILFGDFGMSEARSSPYDETRIDAYINNLMELQQRGVISQTSVEEFGGLFLATVRLKEGQPYSKITLKISVEEFLLKEVVYEYSEDLGSGIREVVINYMYGDNLRSHVYSCFTLETYLQLNDGLVYPSNNYSGFRVFDQRIHQSVIND